MSALYFFLPSFWGKESRPKVGRKGGCIRNQNLPGMSVTATYSISSRRRAASSALAETRSSPNSTMYHSAAPASLIALRG